MPLSKPLAVCLCGSIVTILTVAAYKKACLKRIKRKGKLMSLEEIGRKYLTSESTLPSDARYVGGDKIGQRICKRI